MKAKKSLGQNFLHAKRYIHAAVAAVEISPEDLVVEIGPGKGALTEFLLAAKPKKLIAIETDSRMIELLQERFAEEIALGVLELIHNDVLEVDILQLTNNKSYKLIGNLPFYITGAIFKAFLTNKHQPTSITAIIQKEVGERIVRRDGAGSILSVSIEAYGVPKYLAKIPQRAFNPPPKVDAALIHIGDISRKNFSSPEEEQRFFEIVKVGFAHKRKRLAKNLESVFTKEEIATLFKQHDLSENIRAEELTTDKWLGLINR